ncbi:hypothetical protein HUB98_05660 [Paenibacillus barcinonensis]|uniref:Uncharacterized protein n=2 Tax=Paenibacillus barcinonensis TaxID=198119 RepID=A0ABX6Q1K0_PAEBA|nr:hypothetical protein [Paenibacillus barcinonensis]QKS55866.1 hypothetical protein HUB98_05660 [Paenibacillus barcinonensis]
MAKSLLCPNLLNNYFEFFRQCNILTIIHPTTRQPLVYQSCLFVDDFDIYFSQINHSPFQVNWIACRSSLFVLVKEQFHLNLLLMYLKAIIHNRNVVAPYIADNSKTCDEYDSSTGLARLFIVTNPANRAKLAIIFFK